jgi:hypothetical protein
VIAICSSVADPGGRVVLRRPTVAPGYDVEARVSKSMLLDGKVHISHSGTVPADGQLEITCPLNGDQFEILRTLHESGIDVRVSYWAGCYLGTIRHLFFDGGPAKITILFSEQLA